MADKNIQMTQRNAANTAWDNLHPITKASNVKTNSGSDVESELAQKASQTSVDNILKDYVRSPAYGKTAGTATAYTLILNPAPTTYVDGMSITIVPHIDCGDNPTLKVNSLTALTILKQDGTALKAGDLKINKPYSLVRVGSNFFIRSTGGGGGIKSIQRGSLVLSTQSSTVTISQVDLNCAILRLTFLPLADSESQGASLIRGQLSSDTQILFKRERSGGQIEIEWEVIEFENVKSVQRGTYSINTNTQLNDITISSVDLTKALLFASWSLSSDSTAFVDTSSIKSYLKSSTQINIKKKPTPYGYLDWQVIEFN